MRDQVTDHYEWRGSDLTRALPLVAGLGFTYALPR
jgi:hypothetical protein